jgi:hypothetical protein
MFALASPAARSVAANACHPKQKATNRCARTRPIKVGVLFRHNSREREAERRTRVGPLLFLLPSFPPPLVLLADARRPAPSSMRR